MIVNIIRFAFRDGLSPSDQQKVISSITKTSKMDSVSFSTVGKDLGNPADGFTHAYCAGIENLEALKSYLTDPVHREGDFIFLPAISKLWRFALTDDEDPALSEKIGTIYSGVMAHDAEWQEMFKLIPELHL